MFFPSFWVHSATPAAQSHQQHGKMLKLRICSVIIGSRSTVMLCRLPTLTSGVGLVDPKANDAVILCETVVFSEGTWRKPIQIFQTWNDVFGPTPVCCSYHGWHLDSMSVSGTSALLQLHARPCDDVTWWGKTWNGKRKSREGGFFPIPHASKK